MSGVDNPVFQSSEQGLELTTVCDNISSLPSQYSSKQRKHITSINTDINKSNDSESERLKCGWLWFRPKSLQSFRTAKWALFWMCCVVTLQGMIVNGFINVVITTIEKRFDLKSSQTGLVAGAYDVASFLFLIPISYLGGRPASSKPRYIGLGIIILGLGSLIFASPHFIAGSYEAQSAEENLCHVNVTNDEVCTNHGGNKVESNSNLYLAIFLFAQFLHGAGATPFFTLSVTYLDENVSKKMSSMYVGIYFTMAVVGPALGYVIGGKLLDIYSEFLTIDVSAIGLTPDSSSWIGAWWVGFVIIGMCCILISIPLLAFPATLPGSDELAKQRVSEAHQSSSATTTVSFEKIHEMPQACKTLMQNPAFVMLNFAGACDGFFISGFAAFLPKLIEKQFSLNASTASFLMGLIIVPAGGGGTFLGGYIVKRLMLQCKGILKLSVYATALTIISTFGFAMSCSNVNFAGLNVPYNNVNTSESMTLDSFCNEGCGCSKYQYNPICGMDNFMYYSPCYAGCLQEISLDDVKLYQECSCINANASVITNSTGGNDILYTAINTPCETSCSYLWPFLTTMFFIIFLTFTTSMPSLSATLRVVKDEERSFALGIQWLKVRLFGSIPGPIIIGALIDQTCILWHESCEEKGACIEYDNYEMNRNMLIIATVGKTVTFIFYVLAWKFYVPPKGNTSARTT